MGKGSDHDHPRHTSKRDHEASKEVITPVGRRGEAVAEVRPLSGETTLKVPPDLSEIWSSFPTVPGDSGRFLEEDR